MKDRPQSHGRGWVRATLAVAVMAIAAAAVTVARPAPSLAADRAPTSKPAASAETVKKVREWFAGLSNADPDVRGDARHKLLTLSRSDLPVLRDVVRARVPLRPSESQPLRDIVTHVYLTGQAVPAEDGSRGFVGVYFDAEQALGELGLPGVEIRHRLPGCCAYRYLDDGDVVLSVGKPHAMMTVHVSGEMTQAVQLYSAGDTITFEILRRGRLIHVPVTLGARPPELATTESMPDFLSQRLADANGYWEANFASVLSGASTQATAK